MSKPLTLLLLDLINVNKSRFFTSLIEMVIHYKSRCDPGNDVNKESPVTVHLHVPRTPSRGRSLPVTTESPKIALEYLSTPHEQNDLNV